MAEFSLKNIEFCRHVLGDVRKLYFNSFPPEERRSWDSIENLLRDETSRYNIEILLQDEIFVGFISWWQFDSFCYIEHCAILPHKRGGGFGTNAILKFRTLSKLPIVLEVELPNEDIAKRRVAFYKRNGFEACEQFKYIQPSYGEGLPAVPMMLMVANAPKDVDLQLITTDIYKYVYEADLC